MTRLYKKIFLTIIAFLISVTIKIAIDKIIFIKYLLSLVGLIAFTKLFKKILKTFFKDLDDYLMK